MVGAFAAVDLGATSGRVMLGHVGADELRLTSVSRFPNVPVSMADGLHWDVEELFRQTLAGLTVAVHLDPNVGGVAVDSWACDYGLLRSGQLLSSPFHYRDTRTVAAVSATHARVGAADLYAANGLQHLPFNTLFQLAADQSAGSLERADAMLLIPDLLTYWLTGNQATEITNASTTGLLGVHSRRWDDALIARLGLPRRIFPTVLEAGSEVGPLLGEVSAQVGATAALTVTAVGSHDTASAVVAIPAAVDDYAYISCGTWSLVGVELDAPVLSEAARLARFTNEAGVDGRVRFLHNVMGLWLLSESIRTWELGGDPVTLPELLRQAAAITRPVAVFDPDDPRFLPPGDIPARIVELCREHGLAVPDSRPAIVRSILESLASAYARTLEQARALTGRTIAVVHLVGGGSQNALLCQLTANHTGLTVLAGPAEATALGNVLIQARAKGVIAGSLESLRRLVASAFPPVVYAPQAQAARR